MVDFGAEQSGKFRSLARALDAVATYAYTFEFIAGGVKDVVADIDLLVTHHLGGSEIDEWGCHGITTILLMYIYY